MSYIRTQNWIRLACRRCYLWRSFNRNVFYLL